MGKSFSSGVADGLATLRRMEAEAEADDLGRQLDSAERTASNAESRVRDLTSQNASLSATNATLTKQLNQITAEVSGSGIVIKQVMKLLESFPKADQQRFRKNLAELSLARMQHLDNEKRGRENFLDIEKNFRALSSELNLVILCPPEPLEKLVRPKRAQEPTEPQKIQPVVCANFLIFTTTKFEFDSNVYKTFAEATAKRDEAVTKWRADHAAWDSLVKSNDRVAEVEHERVKLAYEEWMQEIGAS